MDYRDNRKGHNLPPHVVQIYSAPVVHFYSGQRCTFTPALTERLTGALLDRLTHHVHILEMNGDSYRLNQSRKRRKSPKNA
jgi:IstB-like ATP binding protein